MPAILFSSPIACVLVCLFHSSDSRNDLYVVGVSGAIVNCERYKVMGFAETLIFYTVIGIGVAVALLAVEANRTAAQRMFMAATAILFWPVYVPVLLGGGRSSPIQSRESPANDKVSQLIDQVQQELDDAVYRFDGWDDDSLANQRERISELIVEYRTTPEYGEGDVDHLFMLASLHYLLGENDAARDAVERAIARGDTSESTANLGALLDAGTTEPIKAKPARPDPSENESQPVPPVGT